MGLGCQAGPELAPAFAPVHQLPAQQFGALDRLRQEVTGAAAAPEGWPWPTWKMT